jgi:DNA-directed RNA polymerase subunit alpha
MALTEGAKILRKHLNPFVQYRELGPGIHSAPRGVVGGGEAQLESKLNILVSDLRLSVRAGNCLESENIRTLRELVQRSEDQLLEVRNFGETTLNEVKDKLSALGLRLGMRVPSSPVR